MLEFDILLSQGLDLSIGSIEFDLTILESQLLIFQVTVGLKQFILCLVVCLLFFLVTVNPQISRLFLTIDNLIQVGDSLIELLLSHIKLLFNTLLLDFNVSIVSGKLLHLLLKIIDFILSPVKSIVSMAELLNQVCSDS